MNNGVIATGRAVNRTSGGVIVSATVSAINRSATATAISRSATVRKDDKTGTRDGGMVIEILRIAIVTINVETSNDQQATETRTVGLTRDKTVDVRKMAATEEDATWRFRNFANNSSCSVVNWKNLASELVTKPLF